MNYNEINRHSRDSLIHFDSKSHTYTYQGQIFKSVTTIVEECFEQFDTDYQIEEKTTRDEKRKSKKRFWKRLKN